MFNDCSSAFFLLFWFACGVCWKIKSAITTTKNYVHTAICLNYHTLEAATIIESMQQQQKASLVKTYFFHVPPPPPFFFFLLFVCSRILVWGVKMMKILALGYLSDFVTTNFKMSFLSNDLLSWTYTIFCCLQGPYKLFSPNTPTFHKLQEKIFYLFCFFLSKCKEQFEREE